MIELQRIFKSADVQPLLRAELLRKQRCDGMPRRMDWEPLFSNERHVHFRIALDGAAAGLVSFRNCGVRTYELHIVCEPFCRGRRALEAVRMALREIFTKHHAAIVTAWVFEHIREAIWLAAAVGMTVTERGETPFKRRGQPCNRVDLQISYRRWKQQQKLKG